MTANVRDLVALMPRAKHSAARAAVIAAVVMDHRVLVVHDGDSVRVNDFDAAVELSEKEFGDHVTHIRRSYTDTRIIFEGGGEVLFVPARSFSRIRGYSFDMVLEANA